MLLPAVNTPFSGIAAYSFAGLACSGFFPLAVGRASLRFPQQAALVSSLMVAALMLGVGLGSFTLGALRDMFPLSMTFRMAALLTALTAGLGMLTLLGRRNEFTPVPCEVSLNNSRLTAHEGIVICPACGGENPADAVFCGNKECHKALGEHKYVLEELLVTKSWIERLADRVTLFVSRPHFVTLHMAWFIFWILANEDFIWGFQRFDEYPYSLLGIILAIEAILITGFLLISQRYRYDYSEKRAELDYEITVRTYRKLIELKKRLELLINAKAKEDKLNLCKH